MPDPSEATATPESPAADSRCEFCNEPHTVENPVRSEYALILRPLTAEEMAGRPGDPLPFVRRGWVARGCSRCWDNGGDATVDDVARALYEADRDAAEARGDAAEAARLERDVASVDYHPQAGAMLLAQESEAMAAFRDALGTEANALIRALADLTRVGRGVALVPVDINGHASPVAFAAALDTAETLLLRIGAIPVPQDEEEEEESGGPFRV